MKKLMMLHVTRTKKKEKTSSEKPFIFRRNLIDFKRIIIRHLEQSKNKNENIC